MKFMLSWRISTENRKAAAKAFMQTGAPMPDGMTLIGRWHAPGSSFGWLLIEASEAEPIAIHAAQWGDYLDIDVTPVVEDEVAGRTFAKVYGR